jgi:gamma-glutamylcyclotransferase (GGCT)/AIG2-like uncharacterized protein YtfP
LDSSILFVYGTLRCAFQNDYARLLSQNAAYLGLARIRGRLYRVNHYPGVKLSAGADDWVIGELYDLRDPAHTLAVLDDYEGCGHRQPHDEFQRVLTTATLENGPDLSAWVYEYNRPISKDRRILSGDFLNDESS